MTPVLENAVLANNLDCQNYDLKNVGMVTPVPDNLVGIDDPRLDGGRPPAPGSVTDDSVNASAAIDQSKLAFLGTMPGTWLVYSPLLDPEILSTRAVGGSAAEFLSRKGANNGYAALDANGKIPVAHFTPGDAIGALTDIGMTVRPPLNVQPGHITTSGTFAIHWTAPTSRGWFGSDGTFDPQHHEFIYPFFVNQAFNAGMFSLPCSKFTAGTIPLARLPIVKPPGVTGGPAPGLVPDPGANGSPLNYLGRDTLWHHFTITNPALAMQPKVPDVTIVLDWWEAHTPTTADPSLVKAHVTIRTLLKDAHLFYRINNADDFTEALHDKTPDDPHITLEVNEFDFIEAYAAKQGYNNSDIEEWTVFTPISDLTPNPLP